VPTFNIDVVASVDEGSIFTATIRTTKLSNGTVLAYRFVGDIDAADIVGSLTGSVTVSNNVATVTRTIARDARTEGPKVLTFEVLANNSIAVLARLHTVINDTSLDPTYSITPNITSVSEGESVTFTLNTTDVFDGSTLHWTTLSDSLTVDDFADARLSGSLTITGNRGTIVRPIAYDNATDDAEFRIEIRTGSIGGPVVLTSEPVAVNDYNMSIGQAAYTEPGTYEFVVPTGVPYLSAVVIGGGASAGGSGGVRPGTGGGAGALRFRNKIPVISGETLTVEVGAGGEPIVGEVDGKPGLRSAIRRASTDLVYANGGSPGSRGLASTQTTVRAYNSWTSTNTNHGSSSSGGYSLTMRKDEQLRIACGVSSESGFDFMTVTVNSNQVYRQSGSNSQVVTWTATNDGQVYISWTYSKDGSISRGSDRGWISYIDHLKYVSSTNGGIGGSGSSLGGDVGGYNGGKGGDSNDTTPGAGGGTGGYTDVGAPGQGNNNTNVSSVTGGDGGTIVDGNGMGGGGADLFGIQAERSPRSTSSDTVDGKDFGAGGGARKSAESSLPSGKGGKGAVRIIWGFNRIFPSAGMEDQDPITYTPPIPSDDSNPWLLAGDDQLGWYGEVSAADFITGDALASLVNLTAGSSINSAHGWLKFAYKGKTLLTSKRPLRSTISWNDLNARALITGNTVVSINGLQYKVRLFFGNTGLEWDDLMYRVWENDPTGTFWERYTSVDLVATNPGSDPGRDNWCQESAGTGTYRTRGNGGMQGYYDGSAASADSGRGWRPVLELVQ